MPELAISTDWSSAKRCAPDY